jgi:hypothetical protein
MWWKPCTVPTAMLSEAALYFISQFSTIIPMMRKILYFYAELSLSIFLDTGVIDVAMLM